MTQRSHAGVAPLARTAMAYVLAGGRGSRLMEMTDIRAKPAVYFGGKSRIIDFALSNALNSGIRRIGVATQYKAHSLIRHLQRGWTFLRPERNESFDILPASQRVSENRLVLRHRRRGVPEHRHHRGLRAAPHRRPRRRPHLQDGLRGDAAAALRAGGGRDRRLRRGAAHGGDGFRRHARRRLRPHHVLPGEARRPARHPRPAGPRARQHGHLRVRDRVPVPGAPPRRGRSGVEARFRQGHRPLHRQARQGRGAPLRLVLRPLLPGDHALLARRRHAWTPIGKRTSTSRTSSPASTSTTATGRSGPTPRSCRRRSSSTTRTIGAGRRSARWSPAGASCRAPP